MTGRRRQVVKRRKVVCVQLDVTDALVPGDFGVHDVVDDVDGLNDVDTIGQLKRENEREKKRETVRGMDRESLKRVELDATKMKIKGNKTMYICKRGLVTRFLFVFSCVGRSLEWHAFRIDSVGGRPENESDLLLYIYIYFFYSKFEVHDTLTASLSPVSGTRRSRKGVRSGEFGRRATPEE